MPLLLLLPALLWGTTPMAKKLAFRSASSSMLLLAWTPFIAASSRSSPASPGEVLGPTACISGRRRGQAPWAVPPTPADPLVAMALGAALIASCVMLPT